MLIHDRLHDFWAGERPDRIPYTVYFWEWKDVPHDPLWPELWAAGMGMTRHVPTWKETTAGLTVREEAYTLPGGEAGRRVTHTTPVGSIHATYQHGGWNDKFWLQTQRDYEVMTWIVEHTTTLPDPDAFEQAQAMGPHVVPLAYLGRSPYQEILVDLAGLENLAFHQMEFPEAFERLYGALLERYRRRVRITAQGPGRYVSSHENLTAQTLGPERFARYHLPVYASCFPELQAAGKVVGVHYDGATAVIAQQVARSPIDCVESLTEPSEGDQSYEQARAHWPDKLIWANLRVSDYLLPESSLRERVMDSALRAAVDGKRLAFEVSENLPPNWRKSLPVVLETLNGLRC